MGIKFYLLTDRKELHLNEESGLLNGRSSLYGKQIL